MGIAKINAIIIISVPISLICLKNEIINSTNVNAANAPITNKKNLPNSKFPKISNMKVKRNQEITNKTTIINNSFFFDRFFSPEINLIFNLLMMF